MLQAIKNKIYSAKPVVYPVKIVVKNAFYSFLHFILAIPNSILYCLLFVSLLVLEYFNFHLNPDAGMQLQTLTNFVAGHGISISTLSEHNLIAYQRCSYWPAGLVVFLTPIFLVTHNTVASFIILKVIGFIFFILFLSRYLNYLQLEDHQRKFIIFFFMLWAVPVVEFYTSDMIATTSCLWSFYYFVQYLTNRKTSYVLVSIFLVAVCYFIRYSFLPFLMYPALAFILKEKWRVFKSIKPLLLIVIFTVGSGLFFYLLNRWLVGPVQSESRWDAFTGNAHWMQLSHFAGFLFTFGIYEWFFQNMVKNIFDVSITFNWLSLLVTIYFFWVLCKEFFRKQRNMEDSYLYNSINISLSAGFLIVAFLSFLTINIPGQTWLKPYWTYVQDTRYYGPVIIIALINILILFLIKKKGSFLHIIIPVMILLNLFAYRAIVQSGFWGNNYKSYSLVKQNISSEMVKDPSKPAVVYFDKEAKNSSYYYYLQANGLTLILRDKMDLNNSKLFTNYILEKDSTTTFKVIKVN
jgi:hypothetical protein